MSANYDEKTKKWFCTFKYKDWTGKTRKTTKRGFARKKDALAYERDFRASSTDAPDITVGFLVEKYLEDYKLNRKPSSYDTVRSRINMYIVPELKDMPISKITPLVVKNWQNHLAKKDLSPSMIRIVNVTFSTILNYAVKYYNLPGNPFVKTGKTGKKNKKVDFWELDEFHKVDTVTDNTYARLIFNLLFWSGMRIGELEGLRQEDMDFGANALSIKRTYNHGLKLIGPPKTPASIRDVTMPPSTMDMLKTYMDSLYQIPEYPLSMHAPGLLREWLRKYALKAEVPVITLHGLRHSHASYLIKKGVAITAISKRLGHSSPAITLGIYAHVYKESDAEIAEMLEKDFKRTSKTSE